MTEVKTAPRVRRVDSIEEAVSALAELGADGAPLAGGTWVMRAGHRREALRAEYVALDGIPQLSELGPRNGDVRVGANVTHAQLTGVGADLPAFTVVRQAALRSAFPAVRSVATVGGNLAAVGFAEADLVPALLAAEAIAEVAGPDGIADVTIPDLLAGRATAPAGQLIVAVRVPAPAGRRSAFERLTVRGGGEYAVASVAVSVDLDADRRITAARVALGAVEEVARLSEPAAAALVGRTLDHAVGRAAGEAAAADCTPRDDLAAPGWYRKAVLPGLVARAVTAIDEEEPSR